jgi:threonine aldolase
LNDHDPRRVAREICSHFDTVSVCLSKGLGAPVGSLLLGTQATIAKARRWRKMLGGGLRQAGLLAAAGLHALEHHVDRLADDHRRARTLADGLAAIGAQFDNMIRPRLPDTNIVFVDIDARIAPRLNEGLQRQGIAVNSRAAYGGAHQQRWVTHLDIDDDDINRALDTIRRIVAGC